MHLLVTQYLIIVQLINLLELKQWIIFFLMPLRRPQQLIYLFHFHGPQLPRLRQRVLKRRAAYGRGCGRVHVARGVTGGGEEQFLVVVGVIGVLEALLVGEEDVADGASGDDLLLMSPRLPQLQIIQRLLQLIPINPTHGPPPLPTRLKDADAVCLAHGCGCNSPLFH